jgi:type I restriction enzyme S subunit
MSQVELTTLGKSCEFFNGKAHEKSIDENGKYIVVNSKFISSEGKSFKRTNEQMFPLYKGDIVMVMSDVPNGKALAKCFIIDKDDTYSLNQRICCIRSKEFDIKYLYYQLNRHEHFLAFNNGENQTNLRKDDILACPLIKPSMDEQLRIANDIQLNLEKLKNAEFNISLNITNARDLLFSELQGLSSNTNNNWEEKTIGELCNLMTGGTPSSNNKGYYDNGEIKWLVSGDINNEEIYDCEGRITQLGYENSNARYLPANSVLIALNGQGKTRGTVAMLRVEATCNQSLVSIYPKDINTILPEFIYFNLKARYTEIRKITGDSGNDRRGLNMPLIRAIKIKYPKSVDDQKEYINKFKVLTEETKKLEMLYRNKFTLVNDLQQGIIKRAFENEIIEAD